MHFQRISNAYRTFITQEALCIFGVFIVPTLYTEPTHYRLIFGLGTMRFSNAYRTFRMHWIKTFSRRIFDVGIIGRQPDILTPLNQFPNPNRENVFRWHSPDATRSIGNAHIYCKVCYLAIFQFVNFNCNFSISEIFGYLDFYLKYRAIITFISLVYSIRAFRVNSVLSFYYFLTQRVYIRSVICKLRTLLVPEHINEHVQLISNQLFENRHYLRRTF